MVFHSWVYILCLNNIFCKNNDDTARLLKVVYGLTIHIAQYYIFAADFMEVYILLINKLFYIINWFVLFHDMEHL